LNSIGGVAIDGEGNMLADDNFMAGAPSTILGTHRRPNLEARTERQTDLADDVGYRAGEAAWPRLWDRHLGRRRCRAHPSCRKTIQI